ncbi:MAG: hypothetical protein NT004_10735, partial [Bacteroidetes bacterium]|nr:hypothetical protein [Bacteroidota bacterium]
MVEIITYRICKYVLLTVFILPMVVHAKNEIPLNKERLKQSAVFIENKGQIIDQNNKPNPSVLYLLNTPGMNVQLRKGGFSYDLYRISNIEQRMSNIESSRSASLVIRHDSSVVKFHRLDFDLQNANPNPVIETSAPSTDYLNYYTTGTPDEGVTLVKSFGGITYKDVYPGIDLQFICNDWVFEYNFLIQPGADISAIQLKLSGHEKVKKFRDGIRLNTSLGDVYETIPLCYYSLDDIRVPVKGRFKKIADKVYGFSVDQTIPDGAVLLIDPIPTRRWGTYYGGSGGASCVNRSSATDGNGDVVMASYTGSTDNIATAGAYQVTLLGISDAFIVKFSTNGQRLWGTYYGGTNSENAYSCAIDPDDNIIIVGGTSSSNNIASPGAHQTVLHGSDDGFVAKFSPAGQRLWGSYYGGNDGPPPWNADYAEVCSVDSSGNIYFAGTTNAPDYIASPGAHQTVFSGAKDNYLVKFSPDGQRLWGTYYGGTNWEQNPSCAACKNGIVYLTGNTASLSNIATPGSWVPNFNNAPGFLAAFNTSGQRLWGTYYGGPMVDILFGCMADTGTSVYVYGTGTSEVIGTSGVFQRVPNGGGNACLSKFSSSGAYLWGTFYGVNGARILNAAVDDSGYVYVTGITSDQNNVIPSPNGYMTEYQGGFQDAFLAKFNGTGQRVWGTYYGGADQDSETCVAVDANDNIFLSGSTWSGNDSENPPACSRSAHQNHIATPGSFQPDSMSWVNAFLVKFSDCYSPDTAMQINGPLVLCKNSTGVVFTIPLITGATDYHWCVSGNLTIVGGQGTTAITFNVGSNLGFDTISVYGINACDNGFPKSIVRQVLARPNPVISGTDTTCTGMANLFTTVGGKSIYVWTFSPGHTLVSGGTVSDSSCTVYWATGGANWVRLNYTDTTGCDALDPVQFDIWVNAGSQVSVNITPSVNPVCIGNPVIFTAAGLNGGSSPVYQWKVNGIDAGANNPVFSYSPVDGDMVTCILSSDLTCASNNPDTSNAITMAVNPILPVSVSIISSMNTVCAGTQVNFTAVPVNGGTTPQYQWKLNGLIVGTNSPNYSYMPVNGDAITCTLNSNVLCPSGNPAISNEVAMTVNPILPVGVSIVASSNPFCAGSPVTFTAAAMHGGSTPLFQW